MTVRRVLTEDQLHELRATPKRVTNPRAQWVNKPRQTPIHRQRSFQLSSEAEEDHRFEIYQRENLHDAEDFSTGIAAVFPDGTRLTLARYNGSSHEHGDIRFRPHIHRATEDAMRAGKRPERDALATDRYVTVEGALACLIEDFAVRPNQIKARHDQPRLF